VLRLWFDSSLQLGLAQALVAALAALAVVVLARRRGIHLEVETLIAMARGLVQIVAVGSILVILLRAPRWTSGFLLAGMIVAAGATSARRAKGMPGAFRVSAWAIAFGAGSIIALMTSVGVIDTAITSLVPVGSMLIANAMNTNGLALNRFRSDVLERLRPRWRWARTPATVFRPTCRLRLRRASFLPLTPCARWASFGFPD
jgi:putative ABC transport system permease protein